MWAACGRVGRFHVMVATAKPRDKPKLGDGGGRRMANDGLKVASAMALVLVNYRRRSVDAKYSAR